MGEFQSILARRGVWRELGPTAAATKFARNLAATVVVVVVQADDPFQVPKQGRKGLISEKDRWTIVDAVSAMDILNNGQNDKVGTQTHAT